MPNAALPPGPRSALPQLLHLRDPFPLMDRLAREYSDPMTCPLLGQAPVVLTWSQSGIGAVFGADPLTFEPGAPEALAAIVGKGSLFLKSGAEHKRARKLLMPPFHGERIAGYARLMKEATERWLRRFPTDEVRPFLPTAQGITLDVILEAVFGVREPARTARLHDEILAVVGAFNPLVATFRVLQHDFGGIGPWARLARCTAALRRSIDELAREKREQPGDDVLSLLLAARDEEGQPLGEQEIYEQLLTFVIAGHETTATTLSWALYELHSTEGLLEELRAQLAAPGNDSPEALAALPQLRAVIHETLRRHPPLPIVSRRCVRPFRLGNYELPPGQTVGAAVYMAHHDAATFPKPFQFDPKRFTGASPSPFVFLPFGGGARRCIGAAFATVELQIALGTILAGARFELAEPQPVRSVFRVGTYGPETGVRMKRKVC
jgi:cytochrome P450